MKLRKLIWLIILISLITACVPVVRIKFFNNTASTIHVSLEGQEHSIESKSYAEIDAPLSNLRFKIRLGTQEADYYFPTDVPREFYSFGFMSGLHVQVQDSLAVYLVMPSSGTPAGSIPEQPHGFPLMPEIVKSENANWGQIHIN